MNDKRTGIGTYLYGSGEKYIGGFLNGKKHGLGVSYVRKGEEGGGGGDEIGKWQEEWNNGTLISRVLVMDEVTNDGPGRFFFIYFLFFIFIDVSYYFCFYYRYFIGAKNNGTYKLQDTRRYLFF